MTFEDEVGAGWKFQVGTGEWTHVDPTMSVGARWSLTSGVNRARVVCSKNPLAKT